MNGRAVAGKRQLYNNIEYGRRHVVQRIVKTQNLKTFKRV